MKKRLRLRGEVKLIIISVIGLVGVGFMLQALENKNYNDALKRCNNEVVVKYTNTGDRYYLCK